MNAVTLQTTCGGVISFVDAKADAALLEALRQAEPGPPPMTRTCEDGGLADQNVARERAMSEALESETDVDAILLDTERRNNVVEQDKIDESVARQKEKDQDARGYARGCK